MVAATGQDYILGPRNEMTLGVDLGQSVDPTALVLIERQCFEVAGVELFPGRHPLATNMRKKLEVSYTIRAAELLKRGITYQSIVKHIAYRHDLAQFHAPTTVCFDETGMRAAGDMLRARLPKVIGATLTSSEQDARFGAGRWSVSKPNLVTRLLAGIETGDLQIAGDIEDMAGFTRHLVDLRRKISATGHLSFNAREGGHDDYVTAAGLAYWWASRKRETNRAVSVAGF